MGQPETLTWDMRRDFNTSAGAQTAKIDQSQSRAKIVAQGLTSGYESC